MKIKRIKYLDSNIDSGQTNEILEPVVIEAIGFVIKETNEYITLAMEIIEKEYRGQLSIPKIAILKGQKNEISSRN